MSKSKKGVCCICGSFGRLSYEHVPPRAAYNDTTVIEYVWLADLVTGKKGKGRQNQRGIGAYTLCETCNNTTGKWYGGEYVKWAQTGQSLLQRWTAAGVSEDTVGLLNVYPLRFLKQVVTMFFTIIGRYSGPIFSGNYPELMQFVLERDNQHLAPGFRFWMNFYPLNISGPTHLRQLPLASKISVVQNSDGRIVSVSGVGPFDEMAHPPFAFYMTMESDVFPGAQEITQFAQYGYNEQVNIPLHLRVMNSASRYPGA